MSYTEHVPQQNNDYVTDIQRLCAMPATVRQTAQGAAIEGVYHPPVLPWEGHNEDVLFTSDVPLEHSAMVPSERAVIWTLIAISLGMSITALML